MNKISWTKVAWDDCLYWQTTDKKTLKRINQLIKDIQRDPFAGIGKPESLKFDLSGTWSRRIDAVHRIVYRIVDTGDDDDIVILQCRYHY
jgi:toxin YoeB